MSATSELEAPGRDEEAAPPVTWRYGFGGPPPPDERWEQAMAREVSLRQEVAELRRYQAMVARLETALGERAARLRQITAEAEQLRQQVTHHIESERELRVLLLRSQETSAQLASQFETRRPPALPCGNSARAWWRLWV